MDPIRFAIENPIKVAVAGILLCLFGLLSIFEIPKQLIPDVDPPIVTISTFWPGASPQEVASEIIQRQEEKLKNVSGLRTMTSSSTANSGKITLEFDVGVDKDIALRNTSEKLRQVSGYPEEVNEPTISATDDDNSRTIAWLMLRGNDDIDVSLLKTFVEEKVKPILDRADGIASTDVYGGREREMQVRVDAYRMAARGITFRELEDALRKQNVNISAGTITQGKRDYTYRTVGEFTNVGEIEGTVVAYRDGGPVHVRDVATVVDGFKKQFAFVRSKGDFVIAIPARREIGANVITAMANLKTQIEKVNTEILPALHADLRIEQVYDETIYIESAIDLVVDNILVGGLLAVVVLLVFLRSGSATAIIALTIPLSVMGTFLVITMLGRTLNVVLLAGLAFAVGMVVDNAIVVLENIFRHRQMGKDRAKAALEGAREVWGAVLASTLTTVAVFLPVIFIKEEAGQLFGDIAVAISSAVTLSLIVSVMAIPPLAAKFLGGSSKFGSRDHTWFLARWMSGIVAWINRSKLARLAVVVVFIGASVAGSWALMPETDYLPAGNRNLVFGILVSPPGYSLDEFKRMANIVEEGDPDDPWDGLRVAWEAEVGSEEAGHLPEVEIPIGIGGERSVTVRPPPINNFFFVSFGGGSIMGATSKIEGNVTPIVQALNNAGRRIPGVFAFFSQSSLFGRGFSGGASVELQIRGDDREKVVAATKAIRRQLRNSGMGHARSTPSNFDMGRPEIRIIPDRAKAADLGLNVRDIGFIVESCINGAFVGEYKDKNQRIDLVIIVEGTQQAAKNEIAQIPIRTPTGSIVPLASAVEIVETTAPQEIVRVEEMEAVTLKVTPPVGTPLQTTMSKVRDDIVAPLRASGAIDQSIIIAMAGNADKLTQTQRALVGDFRDTVVSPHLFGWSVGRSMLALIGGGLLLVFAAGAVGGIRVFGYSAGMIVASLAVGFLAANPDFTLMLIQSRVVLAVLITYLLMSALFESFLYPFVIMLSVPLAAVGGFAALYIVHENSIRDFTTPIQQLDVLTMLGFVILLGVVVNNAILVVHQALTNIRKHGMSANEAVAESVRSRTRPIFMSALTSVCGMLPLVLMKGAGSELYRGIGGVVVGGLLISTIFTLLVVPAMFSLVLEFRQRFAAAASVSTTESYSGTAAAPRAQIQRGPGRNSP